MKSDGSKQSVRMKFSRKCGHIQIEETVSPVISNVANTVKTEKVPRKIPRARPPPILPARQTRKRNARITVPPPVDTGSDGRSSTVNPTTAPVRQSASSSKCVPTIAKPTTVAPTAPVPEQPEPSELVQNGASTADSGVNVSSIVNSILDGSLCLRPNDPYLSSRSNSVPPSPGSKSHSQSHSPDAGSSTPLESLDSTKRVRTRSAPPPPASGYCTVPVEKSPTRGRTVTTDAKKRVMESQNVQTDIGNSPNKNYVLAQNEPSTKRAKPATTPPKKRSAPIRKNTTTELNVSPGLLNVFTFVNF